MFHRRGKRKMSADETASQREAELRQTVVQLREQLEEEKSARKRAQYEKVREIKTAREREQEMARENMELLKMKQQKDRSQDLTALQDRMTKDFKSKMKEIHRKHEEEKQRLLKELEKERQQLKEERRSIEREIQKQVAHSFETEQKKMTHEMFTMDSQIKAMQDKMLDVQAGDRTKGDVIREMEAKHRAELESYSRSARLSSRQQTEELEVSKREVKERERTMSSQQDRLRKLEADKDHLEEEVRRLRKAESWARASPSLTSPSLTPSTSAGDLTSPRQYTLKERDMVVKNTELTFRVRRLEEQNADLEKQKKEIEEVVEKLQTEQKPLKEQFTKQSNRVNTLNASLQAKEKERKRVTEENEELKKANKELVEEQALQKRRLNQQMNQTHILRMEHQKAIGKNVDLHKAYKKLQVRVKELEQHRRSTSQIPSQWAGPVESEYSSPSVSMSSLDGNVLSGMEAVREAGRETGREAARETGRETGREADAEQAWAKYEEMKREYIGIREHFKKLKAKYDKLEINYRLVEREKLAVEAEISMLRESPISERDSPYDMERSSIKLTDYRQQLEDSKSRVRELESFIIQQDNTSHLQQEEIEAELMTVTLDRDRLQEQLDSIGWEREEGEEGEEREEGEEEGEGEEEEEEEEEEEVDGEKGESRGTGGGEGSRKNSEVMKRLSLVEEMNLKATADVQETKEKAKALDDYHSQVDETLHDIAETGKEEEEEDGEEREEGQERRVVQILREAQETVGEVQELLSSGQDASPAVEKLAALLAKAVPLVSEQDALESSLGSSTVHVPLPVDSSTPSVHSPLVAEMGRLKEELSQKQEAVEQAQQKVGSLQVLVGELEGRLEEEREERQGLATSWEQEITTLQSQLSQKDSKLTRLRRAITQGVNEHMTQQLGHQVLDTLQQCKSSASALPGSASLVAELSELEMTLHSLLHTVFPGMFQETPLPPPPPTTTTSELRSLHFRSLQSEDEVVVTPLSSLSSSSSLHSLTQSPLHSSPGSQSPPPIPSSPPPTLQEHGHPHSPPTTHSPTQSPLHSSPGSQSPPPIPSSPLPTLQEHVHSHSPPTTHSPPETPPTETPPTETPPTGTPPTAKHPSSVDELMVMQPMVCEEISIPLSDFFHEAPPTGSAHPEHSEPPPVQSHTPPKSPLQTPPESQFHTNPEPPSSLPPDRKDAQIGESSDRFDSSPSHLSMPEEEMSHESNEDMREEKGQKDEEMEKGHEQKEAVIEKRHEEVRELAGQSVNGPSHISMPADVFTGGREYMQEDLDEVDLEPEETEHGAEVTETPEQSEDEERHEMASREEDTLSPSLHYSLPPEAPQGRRVPVHTSTASPTYSLGKKRLRSQSMEWDEIEEEEEEEEGEMRSKRGKEGEEEKKEREQPDSGEERLFVAILSYDPEAMCTTGRPEEELMFHEGALLAVQGSVDDCGFYRGSFDGQTGLVPAGFVQEMEMEDAEQRKRLLNQTLTRPHLPSPYHTPLSSSRPASASLLSPSPLSHIPLFHSTVPPPPDPVPPPPDPVPPPPDPPSSVTVEYTREKYVITVSWTPPSQGSKVTGYQVLVEGQVKASVAASQTRVLLSDIAEDRPVMVGVVSYDQDGQQSGVASTTHIPPSLSTPSPVLAPPTTATTHLAPSPKPEKYRLCIVLYDYDPAKSSPSESPHQELHVMEGNLLKCYGQEVDYGYTMAELGESNKRGLVPTAFISEVYGPSLSNPQKYEWKSPSQDLLPATSKLMKAVFSYNTREDSPNPGLELELSFKSDDIITVYGSMDVDGFYCGQVGEAFGIVPSNFLSEHKPASSPEAEKEGKTGEERDRVEEKWDIPPAMWAHGRSRPVDSEPSTATHTSTKSDPRSKMNGSVQPTDDHSGSGSSMQGSTEGKRRYSRGFSRPKLKNPFSRKKKDTTM